MNKILIVLILVVLITGCTEDNRPSNEAYQEVVIENEVLKEELRAKDSEILELANQIESIQSDLENYTQSLDEEINNEEIQEANLETIQELKTVNVFSAVELVSLLESNTRFILNDGNYDLSTIDSNISEYFDGVKFINLVNVEFVGNTYEQLPFLTQELSRPVLSFSNCETISLINLYIGHEPKVSYSTCMGEVLYLENCSDVSIKDATLFGCGTIGIRAMEVDGLTCEDIIIEECSDEIMTIYNSNDIFFYRCEFISKSSEDLRIYESENIEFKFCDLRGGKWSNPPQIYYDSVNVYESNPEDKLTQVIDYIDGEIKLTNATFWGGNEMLIEIQLLYENMDVKLDHGYMEVSGDLASFCTLTYHNVLDTTTIINHREQVKAMIEQYYEDEERQYRIILNQYSNDLHIYDGGVYEYDINVNGGFIDPNLLLNDNKAYISVEEARKIVIEAYPTKYRVLDWKVEDEGVREHDAAYTRMFVGRGVPYYVFSIIDQDISSSVIYINALSKEVYKPLDMVFGLPCANADKDLIQKMLDFIKEKYPNLSISHCAVMIADEKYVVLEYNQDDKQFATINKGSAGEMTLSTYYEYDG